MTRKIPIPKDYIKKFEQLGFGMFVHFGLYSQCNAGEWCYSFLKQEKGLRFEEYAKLKDTFRAGSMAEIVSVAKSAGCKYICLTTRHHEGFSLYDTKGLNDFDVMHSPTGRDLVREFVDECRKNDIVPFFYHTTLDWYHPDFNSNFPAYLEYLNRSVEILCTEYGKIGGLWFDGNWSKPNDDWHEDVLYGIIRKNQPEAMIINTTGLSKRGALGAAIEIDAVTYERGMPSAVDQTGRAKYVAGEMCETLTDHWGAADDINYKSVKTLIEELCECRKVGANFLLNIGPNADGSVPTMQRGTMECIGHWMKIYGKAIYNGRPFLIYTDTRDFWLRDVEDEKTAYLFRFDPGRANGDKNVSLSFDSKSTASFTDIPNEILSAKWMDSGENILFEQTGSVAKFNLLGYSYGQSLCVRVAEIKFK